MKTVYPVTFAVDFPDRSLDRLTTAFRIIVAIPLAIVLTLLTGASLHYVTTSNATSETVTLATGGGVLLLPLGLMIVLRQTARRGRFGGNLPLLPFPNRASASLPLRVLA